VLEKKGILGDTPGRRPGDVSIPVWADGKGLAIDVAVTSPLAASSLHLTSPCEAYALKKHAKYDKGFIDSEYFFSATSPGCTCCPHAQHALIEFHDGETKVTNR